MGIISSNPSEVLEAIEDGANVNAILNGQTMLEVARAVKDDSPSDNADAVIDILLERGALTLKKLEKKKEELQKHTLPPLSKKGTVRGNIKTTGIAGLPRGGTLRRRNRRSRTRKNRR